MYRFLTQNAVALVFLLLVAAFAAASLYGSSLLPAARYEPLGSAAFPKALGVITLFLVALQAISLIRNHASTESSTEPETASLYISWKKYRKPLLMLGAMVLYLAAMSYSGVDFRISTSVFLSLVMCLLARPDSPKKVILIAVASIVLAVVLHLVFKHLFYIDI
ncbi:tripartite tricarboxylate transporter TctB family protein [Thalassospira sp. HF15]|uniref:tripartite tricarboxylate transporter TctB family protein n=1 Tax=Thalassospira sp. HF15 TaxID=2722755 RepID=UPI00142FA865|nr:tripartite tricarboxylate transporter TctB family protein [Thalassospira sp. HF15]NIY75073.1 tripartite tricarboxylate transporter TctB family protein [Thalassospira sp. HF15]